MLIIGPRDGFSEKIADKIGSSFVEIEKQQFPDREVCPRIVDVDAVRGEHALLVNRMSVPTDPNKHLMEFLVTIKNLKAVGAERIDVLMPYFVYAQQDKSFRQGEPRTAAIVLDLLKQAGADRFFTVTAHMKRDEGKIELESGGIDAYNISGMPALADYLKQHDLNRPVVIAPDLTASDEAKEVAERINADTLNALRKTRDYTTREIEMKSTLPDLGGRDLIIVDDLAETGGTLAKAVELGGQANAGKIIAAVVHPVLAGQCLERVKADEFVATDTIDSPISNVSVAGKIVEFLKKLN